MWCPRLRSSLAHAHLAERRLLEREADDRLLDLRRRPIPQIRLPAGLLEQCVHAALVDRLAVAVERVAGIAHDTSSDGGAVLLKAAEKVYGLVAGFVRSLVDRREPGKVRHTLAELLGQRIYSIACGHPDGNDAEHLADDPVHKLLLGRDPVTGARWPRNRRSRGSRTPPRAPGCIGWDASWPRASSNAMRGGST